MTGATADAARVMLPKHRQLVANMIARMNGEMRDMQMASDAEWSTTVDSLRTDLVRLAELSDAELTAMMPAHLAQANRLSTMHGKMLGAMPESGTGRASGYRRAALYASHVRMRQCTRPASGLPEHASLFRKNHGHNRARAVSPREQRALSRVHRGLCRVSGRV